MKVKVSKATGATLDWLVVKCEHPEWTESMGPANASFVSHYSTDWAQGGPIIEREGIWLRGPNNATKPDGTVVLHIDFWYAHKEHTSVQNGPNPLTAAMRCYVTSKLGEEVEIPSELLS